jgi:hypothetical protein
MSVSNLLVANDYTLHATNAYADNFDSVNFSGTVSFGAAKASTVVIGNGGNTIYIGGALYPPAMNTTNFIEGATGPAGPMGQRGPAGPGLISDSRLKTNITYELGNTKAIIANLKPCQYSYCDDPHDKMVIGCLVNEFKEVLPECVENDTIQHQSLIFLLVREIQRLQSENDFHGALIKTLIEKIK